MTLTDQTVNVFRIMHMVRALLCFAVVRYGAVMMTSSNGNIFRITGTLRGESHKGRCRGTLMFSLICLNKLSRRRWFETPSRSSWRHCNAYQYYRFYPYPVGTIHCLLTAPRVVKQLWRISVYKPCDISLLTPQITNNSSVCPRTCWGMTTKDTSTFHITVPLWGESTGYRWIPLTNGQ